MLLPKRKERVTTVRIVSFISPTEFINMRRKVYPLGRLIVTDGKIERKCEVKEDSEGLLYFCFNRNRYNIENIGTHNTPVYILKDESPLVPLAESIKNRISEYIHSLCSERAFSSYQEKMMVSRCIMAVNINKMDSGAPQRYLENLSNESTLQRFIHRTISDFIP